MKNNISIESKKLEENIRKFIVDFNKETDRACVILSAAILENALEKLLKAFFILTESSHDDLFDGPIAPLGSFWAKTKIAYRLGLIDTGLSHDLDVIRKIRNDFAHNITECKFDNASVQAQIENLGLSLRKGDIWKTMRDIAETGIKGDFQMIVIIYLMDLYLGTETIARQSPK